MSEVRETPLKAFHERHGARMVPFEGWLMPVQYTGILQEHHAVRERAGLFDVSHMGEARVRGPQAVDFMMRVMTNAFRQLKVGRARYSMMCYEHGGIVDDIIAYRVAEDEFLICLNAGCAAKDMEWLQQNAQGLDCEVIDECDRWAQLAIQGPLAWAILEDAATEGLPEIGRFSYAEGSVCGVQCIISRTGYTGEDGAEIYCAPEDVEKLAEGLLTAGADKGLILAGLGSRDSLRLEAGMPLYGHEISDTINPLEAGLGWAVKLSKKDAFIGRAALQKVADEGLKRQVLFYELADRRIARHGAEVYAGDKLVGTVLSGTQSPTLGKPIGSALVATDADMSQLAVDVRGKRYPMTVKEPPLVKGSAAREKVPAS